MFIIVVNDVLHKGHYYGAEFALADDFSLRALSHTHCCSSSSSSTVISLSIPPQSLSLWSAQYTVSLPNLLNSFWVMLFLPSLSPVGTFIGTSLSSLMRTNSHCGTNFLDELSTFQKFGQIIMGNFAKWLPPAFSFFLLNQHQFVTKKTT